MQTAQANSMFNTQHTVRCAPLLPVLHDHMFATVVWCWLLLSTHSLDTHVGVACQVVHDLHLALHICNVICCCELALGDGLAGQHFSGLLVSGQTSCSKLPLAQNLAQIVPTSVTHPQTVAQLLLLQHRSASKVVWTRFGETLTVT
jgi:hypothetical protein